MSQDQLIRYMLCSDCGCEYSSLTACHCGTPSGLVYASLFSVMERDLKKCEPRPQSNQRIGAIGNIWGQL